MEDVSGDVQPVVELKDSVRPVNPIVDLGGIEFGINEKRVDVGIINLYGKTAYEVVNEGTLQKEIINLKKDFSEGWDTVIFCVDTEETRHALASLMDAELGDADDRAEIRLLKEFTWKHRILSLLRIAVSY